MADKIPFVIGPFSVKSSFDKKVTKSAPDYLCKALAKAVGKSSKLALKKSVKKDEKGFEVSGTIQEIKLDEKKKTLSTKIEVVFAKLPGPKIIGKASSNGAVSNVNTAKIDGDIKALMEALADSLGGDTRKALEGQISSL